MEQNGAGYIAKERQVYKLIELGGDEIPRLPLGGVSSRERQGPTRSSSFSSGQMEALAALCDTFLPSINISDPHHHHRNLGQSVATFYQTSASMAGTPYRVKELITKKLQHPKAMEMRLTLWLLSTWIGTFILCGRSSLSCRFPYFQRFAKVSPQKRENIVQSWCFSYFSLIRMFFLGIKLLILLAFFTQVNEEKENPSWKAIGYCGPDPYFKPQTQTNKSPKESKDQKKEISFNVDDKEEELFGPLYRGLINLNSPQVVISDILQRSGFGVLPVPNFGNLDIESRTSPCLRIKCDVVVVGSGSGGGVVAGVLAKAGYKVLVLEKGKYHARSNLSLLEGASMDEMYLGSGLLATEDMGAIVLAGSTVGGGSAINWSASIRTPPHVLKEWCEEYEVELFGSRLYEEALDVVCEKMGVQSNIDCEGFNNAILRRGCNELGYPVETIPRNSPESHYCGWCCFGCKDGRKKATTETWLLDLVKSGNGLIFPCSKAIKVLHKQKKRRNRRTATGVAFEFQHKGVKQFCTVESKVTIIACGALCTPPLLKKSGLKNPNIGKNLHLHPVTMAWGYFPLNYWPEPEKKSYEGGIITAMSTVGSNFDKSGYGAILQTPSLHPGNFSVLMPWVSGARIKMQMCKFSRTAHIFALARDKGSGEVTSPSSISYHLCSHDKNNLQRGLEKALRILAAAGAEEIGTHHCEGKILKVKQVSSHEFERFVKEESSKPLGDLLTPICSAHQMGSCRMGVDPENSAVNQMGETWEVEGLYVADSSVFPTALGVNPMVTVQAIAYCTALSVLEVLKRKK